MKEIWKDIEGYEGLYQVSDKGRVKSLKRVTKGKDGTNYPFKERILKQRMASNRLFISTFKDGVSKNYMIHHLVWDHFGNAQRNGLILQIDHIDNNPLNNKIDNLQLLTGRENTEKYWNTTNNTSKYIGVCWDKSRNKWRSAIWINKKRIRLGRFDNEYDAHLAYQEALKQINILQ